MADEPAQRLCVYCSIRPVAKMDHVVAENFFVTGKGDPLPEVMITVPSCHECDSGKGDGGPRDFHLDENYVKSMLVSRLGMEGHPVAKKLIPKAAGMFVRSPSLAITVFGQSKPVTVLIPHEKIVVPTQVMTMDVDLIRLLIDSRARSALVR